MRLWSLHPRHLDRQGLIALWREALLAQKVLAGKTRGYRHHPQLLRFRESTDPLCSIGCYLYIVAKEAEARGYRFDYSKILKITPGSRCRIPVQRGQIVYETGHLLKKLRIRDSALHVRWSRSKRLDLHPLFRKTAGGIEDWEEIREIEAKF
jgi:hypothetical protein